eukprot:TRINITY_DN11812_c0_g1_i1.p1 TRINITY_DN11812_c0_g1~~TRINITY_DN11812_c0_g1_i1.p1  ORF type:complete len:127 (+),score=19.51 TRINITY_DN11812_c0_g1_i1:166-546(+)
MNFRMSIIAEGGISLGIDGMLRLPAQRRTQMFGALLLGNLAQADAKLVGMTTGCMEAIATLFAWHSHDPEVLERVAFLLHQLSFNKDNVEGIRRVHGVELLKAARDRHPQHSRFMQMSDWVKDIAY